MKEGDLLNTVKQGVRRFWWQSILATILIHGVVLYYLTQHSWNMPSTADLLKRHDPIPLDKFVKLNPVMQHNCRKFFDESTLKWLLRKEVYFHPSNVNYGNWDEYLVHTAMPKAGNRGVIIHGYHVPTERQVIIKIPNDSTSLTNSFREAAVAQSICGKPHTVTVEDILLLRDGIALVQPFVKLPAMPLSNHVNQTTQQPIVTAARPTTLTNLQLLMTDLLTALNSLHEKHIAHHDLHDGNVLVDPTTHHNWLIDYNLAFYRSIDEARNIRSCPYARHVSKSTIESDIWDIGLICIGNIVARANFIQSSKEALYFLLNYYGTVELKRVSQKYNWETELRYLKSQPHTEPQSFVKIAAVLLKKNYPTVWPMLEVKSIEEVLARLPSELDDFVRGMLALDPRDRLSAGELLQHKFLHMNLSAYDDLVFPYQYHDLPLYA